MVFGCRFQLARTGAHNINLNRVFIDRGLFLNTDSTNIEAWSPHNMRNSVETVKLQCQVNGIAISLPNIRNRSFWSNVLSYNQFTTLGFEKEEILSTLILNPWNLKVDYSLMWQRWNLSKENPWKRIKLNCDSIHFHLNPSYVNTFSEIASHYKKYFSELSPRRDGKVDVHTGMDEESTFILLVSYICFYDYCMHLFLV